MKMEGEDWNRRKVGVEMKKHQQDVQNVLKSR